MTRQFTILILIILALQVGCEESKKGQETEQIRKNFSYKLLIDNFKNELFLDTSNSLTEVQFSPIYIGPNSDTIKLTYKPEKIRNRTEKFDKFKWPNPKTLQLFIDTSRVIGSPMDIWEYYKTPEYRRNIKSYPIFIENLSSETIYIGYGDILPIIIEAKDQTGNWKQIQKPFTYDCETGLTEFYLAPHEISVSAMKIFNGNFKTKLRLAFDSQNGEIYSNEIYGNINQKLVE